MKKFTTDELVEIVRMSEQEDMSYKAIADVFNVTVNAVGNFLRKTSYRGFWEAYDKKPIAGGCTKDLIHTRRRLTGQKYVFTYAQNNTYVCPKWFKALKKYCEIGGFELIVSTGTYNKNKFQQNVDEDVWYDPKIRPYICNEQLQVCEGLVFCGELNIIPTAVKPMTGFANYTGEDSLIIPHTKLQLQSLPRPAANMWKHAYTTGAVTQKNYVQQKAGQKAEWHHVFSALVVEIDDDGDFFPRHISAKGDTGCFYDLNKYYTPKGCDNKFHKPVGINLGDVHIEKVRPDVKELMWLGESSLIRTMKPKYVFCHDVHDQARRNHHNMKDPYYLFKMHNLKKECVREEVGKAVDFLIQIEDTGSTPVVVESNHDLALERWLKEQDYRKDPVNALFFLEMQLHNYRDMAAGNSTQTFKSACQILDVHNRLKSALFLKTDEPFVRAEIHFENHGDKGNSGARGSISAFLMQGIKANIGHGHGANIIEGIFQSGVLMMAEDSGYAYGGSTWSNSSIITYENGKRAILTERGGKIFPRYDKVDL